MLLLNLLLALVWVGLTGHFTPENLLVGFVIGFALLWVLRKAVDPESVDAATPSYFTKAWQGIEFVAFFLWALVQSNLRVAVEVLRPRPRLQPAVVEVSLDEHSPAELMLLANLITLTPGTLSLDISDDRRVLLVHAMHVDDVETFRHHIRQDYARRVRELLR